MTVPLALRVGTHVEIFIPWPRYPLTTPTGKVSKAKDAGKPIPFLSTNVLHSLNYIPPGVANADNIRRVRLGQAHGLKVRWRDAAEQAATADVTEGLEQLQITHHVEAEIRLYRLRANAGRQLDPSALIEGAKPIVDGLVRAGVLRGDKVEHISYSRRSKVYPCAEGEQRVEILLRPPV